MMNGRVWQWTLTTLAFAAFVACSGDSAQTDGGGGAVDAGGVGVSDGGQSDAGPGGGEVGTTEDVTVQPEVQVTQDASEADGAGDATEPEDVEAPPGSFGTECEDNVDCFSGYCVQSYQGEVCSKTCEESCPTGWSCELLGGQSEPAYVCLPLFSTLCLPCTASEQCVGYESDQGARCVQRVGSSGVEGAFCGGACDDAGCPAGYSCQDASDVEGATSVQCMPVDGAICQCTRPAIDDVATTACTQSNDLGTCEGTRLCEEEGLTVCSALVPSPESCNGVDDDCSGGTDEPDSEGCTEYLRDDDGDGFGVADDTACLCAPEAPYDALDGGDCDDDEALVNPAAEELCDGVDNNCADGLDEGFADLDTDGIPDCVDVDDDGDGDPDLTDCAPQDPTMHAGAEELCNGLDDNCNQIADENLGDTDADGVADCVDPDDDGDGALDDDDCEPLNPAVHPEAEEVCNGVDDDCVNGVDDGYADTDADGVADCLDEDLDGDGTENFADNCPSISNTDQADLDGDSQGDACDGDIDGDGSANEDDCEPTNLSVHPGATELCDGVDQDCDGDVDEGFSDLDGDAEADCVDDDDDGDTITDGNDNCSVVANAGQEDQDEDGVGDACENDTDGDGDPDQFDCAPQDGEIHHGATEVCDGDDDNCNGIADEGFPDADGDAIKDCVDDDDDGDGVDDAEDNCPKTGNATQIDSDDDGEGNGCDLDDDDDGVVDELDCAPLDGDVFPGAEEVCNGKDDDCDAASDEEGAEGCTLYYYNQDGDSFGIEIASKCLCTAEHPYTASQAGDCQDTNGAVFPGANELCNGGDDDCDAEVDEPGAGGCLQQYVDLDFDGYGTDATCVCAGTAGYAVLAGDCNDADPNINPGEAEACGDGVDNDCSGAAEEPDASGCQDYWRDGDDDGFGVLGDDQCLCAPDGEYTAMQYGDCDDGDGANYPGNDEVCDGKDNNCSGGVDEGVTTTYWLDDDDDGYGGETIGYPTTQACTPPEGYADNAEDCDDGAEAVNPVADEVCDGVDNNCAGGVDEGFADSDEDGIADCVEDDTDGDDDPDVTDCAPTDPAISHGATETCDGVDNDCDEAIDEADANGCEDYWRDGDDDTYGVLGDGQCLCEPTGEYTALQYGDCDDEDGEKYPTNAEVCDGKDNNCSGAVDEDVKSTWYLDNDGDGYGGNNSVSACEAPDETYVAMTGDCNDFNGDITPGIDETCNDIDDNCNGQIDEGLETETIYKDGDGDGIAAANALTDVKCDVPVGWTTSVDVDDDGEADWDCDDTDITIYPGSPTLCGDGKDNDCDGFVDRLCFTNCPGTWPFQQSFPKGANVEHGDLDGDGKHELFMRSSFGFAILKADGTALYDYSQDSSNYGRASVVLADIDDYTTFGAGKQTLEVLTANGSRARFYRLDPGGTVTLYENTGVQVYDASKLMAADFDRDGVVEFVTAQWGATPSTRIMRFDKAAGTIDLISDLNDPDNVPCYADGRLLTDLDDDGVLDLLYGNGWLYNDNPGAWGGKVYAYRFDDDLTAMPYDLLCTPGSCFDTAIDGLFPGRVVDMRRIEDEIRLQVTYYTDNQAGVDNETVSRMWRFDLSGLPIGEPVTNSNDQYAGNTDVDDDGDNETENRLEWTGLYDVNGDGYPDKFVRGQNASTCTGTPPCLRLYLWNPDMGSFKEHTESEITVGTASGGWPLNSMAIWDHNDDGRLDVAIGDDDGMVHCKSLGAATWHKYSSLPPYRTMAYRTNQQDNYEPNDGADTDADGLPDEVIQIPSALTAREDLYSYLHDADDEDYFIVDANWGGSICLRAPQNRSYTLSVYSTKDKINNATLAAGADGQVDGLLWDGPTTDGGQVCWAGNMHTPNRHGEYKFIIGIRSTDGDASPHWPYWIHATK